MTSKNLVNKHAILAIIQANRALGADYDEPTADQIYELLKKSQKPTELTVDDVLHYLDNLPIYERKRLLRPFLKRHSALGTVSAVMALSIPMIAIAGSNLMAILAILGFDVFVILLSLYR